MQLSYLGQRPVILAPEWSEALQTKGRAALLQEGGSSVSILANESALALGMSREPARAWAGVRAASHRPPPLVIAEAWLSTPQPALGSSLSPQLWKKPPGAQLTPVGSGALRGQS